MDYIIQQLSHLDIAQLLVMGVMLWVLYARIIGKMDKLEDKLTVQIQKVDDKLTSQIQKLDEKVTDIDRRVCRLEGAFQNKELHLVKKSTSLNKA